MNYDIRSLHLKRGAIIVCNVLEEREDSYKIHVYDVKDCPFNLWTNGNQTVIHKSLLKQ